MKTTHMGIVFAFISVAHEAMSRDQEDTRLTQPAAPASRWSVSAGAATSSMKTSFNADGSRLSAFVLGVPGGSSNLFSGGATPQVYKNGSVGLPVAFTYFDTLTGYSGGSMALVQQGTSGTALSQATFYSTLAVNGSVAGDAKRDVSAGSYIRVEYLLKDWGSSSLSAFGQYTFSSVFHSGLPSAAGRGVNQNFTYDVYSGTGPESDGLVYDVTPYLFHGQFFRSSFGLRGALPPTSQTTQTSFLALIPERISIAMHTLTLGLALKEDLCSRAHLVVSTGPTLNLFDYDLSTPGVANVNGTAVSFAAPQSSSSQKLRFGWVGQAGVTFDLDSRKLYYVELTGEYRWVDGFTATTSLGSAKTDASSWGVNLGFGRRF
jgi:hypothetical protein